MSFWKCVVSARKEALGRTRLSQSTKILASTEYILGRGLLRRATLPLHKVVKVLLI